jgi:glutathionylspermidine synthase
MKRLTCASPPLLGDLLRTATERRAANDSYWITASCYAMQDEALERLLKPAAGELWQICRDFAARAVRDDEILASLGIPEHAWAGLGESWQRGDPVSLARFDLSFDGVAPPKLHECNIDVVGLLFEATCFQTRWMDHQRQHDPRFHAAGQLAAIADNLAPALGRMGGGQPVRLLSLDADPYDDLWLDTHRGILAARGLPCVSEARHGLDDLCRSLEGSASHASAPLIVKSFRWDRVTASEEATRRIVRLAPRLLSPMWTLVLSSKGCLPWLWALNPGHPNLLPAYFTPQPLAHARGIVAKPLFSIEGQNITLRDHGGQKRVLSTGGPDTSGRRVFQELCYLPRFMAGAAPRWASTGAWIAGEAFAAISLTESSSPVISSDTIHYVPHVIV